MNSLKGKVAIVTGAATGIGRATALYLAERGVSVMLADMNMAETENTGQMIANAGGQAAMQKCDVSKESDCAALVSATVEAFGKLDYAFNNAGISDQGATHECTAEQWQKVIDVNLTGVFYCMKHQIAQMLKQGTPGSIVNCASILGEVGFAGAPAYVAAKHGVVGLTKAAALEYGTKNIRINAVGPAFIRTPMLTGSGLLDDPATVQMLESLHPIGRLGEPEEIASIVSFLFSDEASFLTGQNYLADGGYTTR